MKEIIEKRIDEISVFILSAMSSLDKFEVGTKERHHAQNYINLAEFAKSELNYVLVLINDSSAKICQDGEQPPTEVEPNNSGDAPSV